MDKNKKTSKIKHDWVLESQSSTGNLPIPKSSCSAEDGSGLWHWRETTSLWTKWTNLNTKRITCSVFCFRIRKELHIFSFLFQKQNRFTFHILFFVFCSQWRWSRFPRYCREVTKIKWNLMRTRIVIRVRIRLWSGWGSTSG